MKKISKREISMLACVLVIGAILLGYFYYYQPLVSKGETLKAELIQKTEEFEELSEKAEGRQMLVETESKLIKELRESLEMYYLETDIEEYIVQLNTLINEAGIELNVIEFQKPDQGYLQINESIESKSGTDDTENTKHEEDLVSGSEYGLNGGEFTIFFTCDYSTTTKFLQIIEKNQKSIVCNMLNITPAADDSIYVVTMSLTFLEVYGMDDYLNSDNQRVLQDHPYEYAIIKNPFEN